MDALAGQQRRTWKASARLRRELNSCSSASGVFLPAAALRSSATTCVPAWCSRYGGTDPAPAPALAAPLYRGERESVRIRERERGRVSERERENKRERERMREREREREREKERERE